MILNPSNPPPIPPRASLKHKGMQLKSPNAGKRNNEAMTDPATKTSHFQRALPSESAVQVATVSPEPKSPNTAIPTLFQSNTSRNKKKKPGTTTSAIRGRIRKHSDDSS